MLEECGLPVPRDPGRHRRGRPVHAEFLAISPNNKIPAIVDPDGPDGAADPLFESGPSCCTSRGQDRALPAGDTRGKYEVLQWLMFQMGGVGPMLGQAHHFRIYAPERSPTPSTAIPTKRGGCTA